MAGWYDASLGRFISEDPIKGSMISSQSQNPYVYCMNNPLRYVDPTGMMLTDDCINADMEANEALEQSLPSGPPAIDPIIDIINDIIDMITPGGNVGNSSSNNDNNPYDSPYYDTSGDRTYSDDFGGPYSGSTGEMPSGIIIVSEISGGIIKGKEGGTATVITKNGAKDYVYEGDVITWPGFTVKFGIGLVYGNTNMLGKSYSSSAGAYSPIGLGGEISVSTNEDLSSRTLIFCGGIGTPKGKTGSISTQNWIENLHIAGWDPTWENYIGM